MSGIISYGLGLPYYRIKRETILGAMGWFNPGLAALSGGEKAVANYDEDSLTLAVSAGLECFSDVDRSNIRALFLASTTLPYRERNNASIAAAAMNLTPEIRTAEFCSSVRAGTTALIAALEDAGNGIKMVCATDCRLGKAGGSNETLFGDAAVAFAVGQDNIIAEYEGSVSLAQDFADHRRINGDQFVRSWEERWVREEGYTKFIPQTVSRLMAKAGLSAADLAKVIFPPIGARDHAALAKSLSLAPGQVQGHLIGEVGHSGAAHSLLMLAAALDESKPGDRILAVGFGGGCDALLFRVTDAITKVQGRNSIKKGLERRQELESYTKYLSFKDMINKEAGIRGEEIAVTSLSLTWRERDAVLRLVGGQCQACGTPQFPRERICINPHCGAVDQMKKYAFSDKTARLFTYTADNLTYSEDPPALYGIVDFEGGGRYWFDITDCRLESLKVGQQVQMTFRRKYQDRSRSLYGYFWKAIPFRG